MMQYTQFQWLNEDEQIAHVTKYFTGQLILTALVNLKTDTVEIIGLKYEQSVESGTYHFDEESHRAKILQETKRWAVRQNQQPYPAHIRWYDDGMNFETIRESHEWAYSVVYNEIGTHYDGYKTLDEKIAYALVFELTRFNTFHGPTYKIFANEEFSPRESKTIYRVWVERDLK